MKKAAFLLVVFGLTAFADATTIDVTVTTNKGQYLPGENVRISVTAYNPNPEMVSLSGGYDLFSYTIDDIYTGTYFRLQPGSGIIILMGIAPYDYETWHSTYDAEEMQVYPLGPGWHRVVGRVSANEPVGDNESTPYYFYVVPEPATLLLLGLGTVMLRKKVCRLPLGK